MIKFSECSKAVQTILAAGSVATALVAVSVPAVWALDTRYVTVASVEQAFQKRDVRDMKRMIRKLEFLEKNGSISELEQFELKGLRQELEDLEDSSQ